MTDILAVKKELAKILKDLGEVSQDAAVYADKFNELLYLLKEIEVKFKKEHKKAELVPQKFGIDEKHPSEHYTQTKETREDFVKKKHELIQLISARNYSKHSQYLDELLQILQNIDVADPVKAI